jgi:hypothetical protein
MGARSRGEGTNLSKKADTKPAAKATKQASADKPKKQAAAIYEPKRAHGSPAIGFPALEKPPPWTLAAQQAFELELLVRSAGGKGKGLFVSLEGEAMSRISVSHVECGEQRADFVDVGGTKRAELPGVELVAGVRYPFDPPAKNDKQKETAHAMIDACQFRLKVHGKARGPASDLLRVSCGALESQATPMMWMRPLVIE